MKTRYSNPSPRYSNPTPPPLSQNEDLAEVEEASKKRKIRKGGSSSSSTQIPVDTDQITVDFISSKIYTTSKEGFIFKSGAKGQGYYRDEKAVTLTQNEVKKSKEKKGGKVVADVEPCTKVTTKKKQRAKLINDDDDDDAAAEMDARNQEMTYSFNFGNIKPKKK